MIIAIDGPSGGGKSTIAKMVAKELGYYFLNTGSFYRATTYSHLLLNRNPMDKEAALDTAKNHLNLSVKDGSLYLDGNLIEDKLHGPNIDMPSSLMSSDPALREVITQKVREFASDMNIVTEGRDTTTVIFPNADYKFYFDADPKIRAERRFEQQKSSQSFDEVLQAILLRDENDRNKPVGALKIAKDAIYIDTSYLTIKQVCAKVINAIQVSKH